MFSYRRSKRLSRLFHSAGISLLVLCLMLLWGCGSNSSAPAETTEPSAPPESTASTDPGTLPESLSALREEVSASALATAYLGYLETEPENGILAYLQDEYPEWMADMDFISQIPEDRIIGTHGALHCIVPRDPNASVAVNRVLSTDSQTVTEVVYRSEQGDPILLYDLYNGETSLSVVITESDGGGLIWYLEWGEFFDLASGEYIESPLYDFTPVSVESAWEMYHGSGWFAPDFEYLKDTFWRSDYGWAMELISDSGMPFGWVKLYDVDEIGALTESYRGTWEYMDGYLHLAASSVTGDREPIGDSFPVLADPWGSGYLWIGNGTYSAFPYFAQGQEGEELTQPVG